MIPDFLLTSVFGLPHVSEIIFISDGVCCAATVLRVSALALRPLLRFGNGLKEYNKCPKAGRNPENCPLFLDAS